MIECPECGKNNCTTETVTEQLRYGTDSTFSATYPIRHCEDCKFSWIDWEGQTQITVCQFRHEKSIGLSRTNFTSEEERKLWEGAQ